MGNEADTCRKFVVPKLQAAGWDNDPRSIAEQRTVTDGRVIPVGKGFVRKPPKRVDYLLRYTRDFPLAVVEAKASYKSAADAVQQARTYAEMLGLRFAYATNGKDIIEIDYFLGTETRVADLPKPEDLWRRYQAGSQITAPAQVEHLLAPYNTVGGKTPRYYQHIAINRTVEAILGGRRRLLLAMATGTGKTTVAFQICWKLWSSCWNAAGEHRKPHILFLVDRNILIDDPKGKDFSPFGDARHKIESGEIIKSREMYFAIYQALAEDERGAGLVRDYPPDFFDLVIVDECHRGSARDDSSWRVILEYFKPAFQLGMTATPLREESRGTYLYFGSPLYEYSLRQGIDDGFLVPYPCIASRRNGTRRAGGPRRTSATATAGRSRTHGQSDFFIHYIDPDSRAVRSYYPDSLFLREEQYGTERCVVVEVKADNEIDDAVVQAKKDFAHQVAVASGMEYRIIKATDALDRHYRSLL